MEQQLQAKFEIQELLGIGFTIIVLGLGMSYGLQILGEQRDDLVVDAGSYSNCNASTKTNCTAEINATMDSISGASVITSKTRTIATVVVASVIIGVLITYLWGRFANK